MGTRLGFGCTRWGFLTAAAIVTACGGSSTSETSGPATSGPATSGPTGSGSTTSSGSGSGGSGSGATSSGSTTSGSTTSSTTGQGGAGGDTGAGGSGMSTGGSGMGGSTTGSGGTAGAGGSGGGSCPVLSNFTLAVHVVLNVSWPGTTAAQAGTGKVHIWNRTKLTANGSMIAGDATQSCGSVLPEFSLTPLASALVGGSKVLIEIPHTIWDAPTMPKFHSQGTLSSWSIGGKADFDPTYGLVGLTMPDPKAAWPTGDAQRMNMLIQDHDNDMKPGFTAVPRTGNGYVQPPLSTIGVGPKAERLYLTTRTVIALHGSLTGCEEISGTADVPQFDSRVVGCKIAGQNADCMPSDANNIDMNKTEYKPESATFTAKRIPDTATCADVRAALP